MSEIRIGTSGFSFPDWRKGVIYPKGLAQKEELIYYAQELGFDCLEINATYYALISDKSASAMEKKTGICSMIRVKESSWSKENRNKFWTIR